jgi:hypothetical protein
LKKRQRESREEVMGDTTFYAEEEKSPASKAPRQLQLVFLINID